MASGAVFLGLTALIAIWASRIRDQFVSSDDLSGADPATIRPGRTAP
jgi:hypothetical protein